MIHVSSTRAALLIPSLLLVGCAGLFPEPPPPPRGFDFGPLPVAVSAGSLAKPVNLVSVRAPSWLDGPEIRYRQLDRHPGALSAYAGSEWVAPPAELLEQRLRHRLASVESPANAAAAPARLEIELQAFEQLFEGPQQASVIASARAVLSRRGAPATSRVFSIEAPSTPDVAGATRSLPDAADALVEAVLAWLSAEVAVD
ncbi:MAG: hypothetical protein EA371_11330 [Gammaproteobacteria bacterium]|nr:MAG: hypothetical protein EA371_11330 [Gammaproteobacteria bacterium]